MSCEYLRKIADYFNVSADYLLDRKYLFEEHIEMPKLTKKERLFCELMETGWIARNQNGALYAHEMRPIKKCTCWMPENVSYLSFISPKIWPNVKFEFISWEDSYPWSVDDLLKLEVEE